MRSVWIGISCNYMRPEPRRFYPNKELQYGESWLVSSVAAAGATAVLLPFLEPLKSAQECASMYLERLDGIVISGGADIDPSQYGEALLDEKWRGYSPRDHFEIALFHEARKQKKPILGICRGHQLINVALGGSLYQDISSQRPQSLTHRDQEKYDKLGHGLRVHPGTRLAGIIGAGEHKINSVHHQAIKTLAKELNATAFAEDGIIEAVEGEGCLGVQWHPEWMQEQESAQAIFKDLVERARAAR